MDFLIYFAVYILILLFSIIFHEIGHLVFGLLSGYGFSSFRVGGLMLIKQNGRLKLRRHSIAGTAGQCLMTPPELKDGKMPVVIYNLGGVFANILLAAILYALSFCMGELNALALQMGALISLSMAAFNGIPLKVGGIANDGMNAAHLRKDQTAAVAFRNQLLMNAAQAEGVRISDMPDEWFTLPENADMQNVLCASIAVFSAGRPLDRGDTKEAERQIISLLDSGYNIIGLHKNLLTCDLIYCRLVNDPKADISGLIGKEQDKFMRQMNSYPSVIRTEYALALLFDKNEEKAEQIMSNYEKITKKFPYPQEVKSEMNLMLKALEIYNSTYKAEQN